MAKPKPIDLIEQIDAVLTEDGKSVWLHGYTADDTCYLQVVDLPMHIAEQDFNAAEWKAAAKPEPWRLLGGIG